MQQLVRGISVLLILSEDILWALNIRESTLNGHLFSYF